MTRTFVQLAIMTAVLSIVGPPIAASSSVPVAEQAPRAETASASASAPASTENAGLCGITPSDVASIVDHYQLSPDMDGVADMLEVPFQCSAYGELCSMVGAQAAHAYACTTWMNLRNLESAQYVHTVANELVADSAPPCPTPDVHECLELCEPYPVQSCHTIAVGSGCYSIAACDNPWLEETLIGFRRLVSVEGITP